MSMIRWMIGAVLGLAAVPASAESLVIATSSSVRAPVEALGHAFEAAHPDVQVRIYIDQGLDLRRTIAAIQNDGRHASGAGAIHLVAPANDELLDRLTQKYYILPDTRTVYARVRLVLVVPESLADAPASFEDLGRRGAVRVAVADPRETELGQQTWQLLEAMGLREPLQDRMDVAADARGVVDHLLHGRADVGILFSSDAVRESERVRIVATARHDRVPPLVHSLAMDRFCPDRDLGRAFLQFTTSEAARAAIRRLGYGEGQP